MLSAAAFAGWMLACFAMFGHTPVSVCVELILAFPDTASHTLSAVIAMPLAVLQLPF